MEGAQGIVGAAEDHLAELLADSHFPGGAIIMEGEGDGAEDRGLIFIQGFLQKLRRFVGDLGIGGA